uniref:Uncharacterized protein n=1 Tax=Salix viminalis TaxID=40686 RepID=A0A6N2N9J6_SALVM
MAYCRLSDSRVAASVTSKIVVMIFVRSWIRRQLSIARAFPALELPWNSYQTVHDYKMVVVRVLVVSSAAIVDLFLAYYCVAAGDVHLHPDHQRLGVGSRAITGSDTSKKSICNFAGGYNLSLGLSKLQLANHAFRE